MIILSVLAAGFVAATGALASKHQKQYSFKPEKAETIWNGDIPVVYDFGDSQSTSYSGSWWTSSYITGTNGEQYLVISHYLDTPVFTYFRASTLNLETLHYNQFITLGNSTANSTSLDVKVGNNGIQSLTTDNISQQRAYANDENVTFDITFDATSRVISNAGAGVFQFGPSITYEWGLPNCLTQGSITNTDGKNITVDPAKSFTWYDRQWGTAAVTSGNWTWFQMHIPETSYKLSIWIIDNDVTNQFSRFATIRGDNDEILVLPLKWKPIYGRTYQSTAADILYPLDWELDISGFGVFQLSSILDDQEIVGTTAIQTAYEGFVTFNGTVHSKTVQGYGLVEIVYSNWESL
ncbi:hypothetical protein FALCPG4_007449 [Fusarium falciforme]